MLALACNHKKAQELSKIEKPVDSTLTVAIAPEWSKNATIYEVNLRQYSKNGTINEFIPHLQRLKDLGIDILWIMPPYPIGKENRKGGLGSPYSISDYTEINSDLGTKVDFKNLVVAAHKIGMKVILDWVGNHTAFDHKWTKSHPEWYTKDSLGNITHPPTTDWTDVADLNYDDPNMRNEMIKDMAYWVNNFDIDGYRCDVAGFVPNDFWLQATDSLNKIKPLFWLAEWDDPSMHYSGFHMTYGWELHHVMNEIAKGNMEPKQLDSFLIKDSGRYPAESYRMNFTTNHDENSWNGTVYERMGKAADAMTVLAFTWQGMPLIYSGQEAGLNKRLSFFEKDEINWSDLSKSDFFKKLLALHHRNEALWNGNYGAKPVRYNCNNDKIYAYSREKDNFKVIVILNLSDKNQKFTCELDGEDVNYKNIMTEETKTLSEWEKAYKNLNPWQYIVLEKQYNN